MGSKRPLEGEFEEASFKQAKQLDSDNKWALFARTFSSHNVSQPYGGRVGDEGEREDVYDKSQLCKGLRDDGTDAALDLVDKELETSAPLSWVTSSSSEEDAGSFEPLYLPFFQDYFDFNFPRRTVVQLEDAYSSMLNSSPRKQVPIGPEHQADLPVWCPDTIQKESGSCSHYLDDKQEQNVLGTPVFPLSDLDDNSYGDKRIGQGREDCGCFDEGSMRCVHQHVKEARHKLREVLGEDKFADLGFYDMGEEVGFRWTEEEESIFHDVVFSNPQSLGKNFWRLLSAVFPSRTMKELVSYYFNVFMLRRRGIQNRSDLLEIDSDDDEWHASIGGFGGVEEDEDSVVDSFADQSLQEGSEDENDQCDEKKNDGDDDSDDGEGDGDFGGKGIVASAENGTEKHNLSHQTLKSQCEKLPDIVSSDCAGDGDCGIQEDSGISSETQQYMMTSFHSVIGADVQSRGSCDFKACSAGESNGSNDGSESDSVFLLETCDAQVWDGSCSTGLVKGVVDLLPTCNIIEEIFGPCNSKSEIYQPFTELQHD